MAFTDTGACRPYSATRATSPSANRREAVDEVLYGAAAGRGLEHPHVERGITIAKRLCGIKGDCAHLGPAFRPRRAPKRFTFPAVNQRGATEANAGQLRRQRHVAGGTPTSFLNARLNAASEAFHLRRDVRPRPGAGSRRAAAGLPPRRADRPRQLDARRLRRPDVQGGRRPPPAAGRPAWAAAVGHRGAARRAVRRGGARAPRPAAGVHLPLPLHGALAGGLPHLVRPHPPCLRGALAPEGQDALAADLAALVERFNVARDGTMVVPSAYLEAVVARV